MIPLGVNFGYYPSNGETEKWVTKVQGSLESISINNKLQLGYQYAIKNRGVLTATAEKLLIDLETKCQQSNHPNSGIYWRRYKAAVKFFSIIHHNSLTAIFLDEHVAKLLSILFESITENDVISCHIPTDILVFGYGA